MDFVYNTISKLLYRGNISKNERGKDYEFLGLGRLFANGGEKIATKFYALKYGQQIGKTAKNGSKVFCKMENGRKVLTGIDREGKLISQVKTLDGEPKVINFKGNSRTIRAGQTEKVVYTKFGRVDQLRYSERGAMYENTVIDYDRGFYNCPRNSRDKEREREFGVAYETAQPRVGTRECGKQVAEYCFIKPVDFKKTELYFGDTPRMYVMDSTKRGQYIQNLG